jgi:hypothetical protein
VSMGAVGVLDIECDIADVEDSHFALIRALSVEYVSLFTDTKRISRRKS